MATAKRATLFVIFLTVFLDLIGFGIVLPLLPHYSETLGAQGFTIGLIISSYSIMQFVFAPWWGKVSDRIGRRPVVLLSTLGSTVSYALFALASRRGVDVLTGLSLLLVSRVFAGFCGANTTVASAYIADITPPDKRSKGMAMIGVAFGLGFILGPALGALTAGYWGPSAPGWVAAGLCGSNFVLAYFILGESRKPAQVEPEHRPRWEEWLLTVRRPRLALLVGIFFLANFCLATFESTLPLFLGVKMLYGEKEIGWVFAFCGLVTLLVQGGVIGRVVKRFGEPRVISGGLVLVAGSLALLPFLPGLALLLVALGVFSVGAAFNRAPMLGLISLQAHTDEQGAVLGTAQSAGTLARIIGPPFATALYGVYFPLPYTICAAVAVIGLVLTAVWRRRFQTNSTGPAATAASPAPTVPPASAGA